jgi:predicted acylesterase/phospholipase RssA
MSDAANPKRRSLILAGGGMKVAFQAGVLSVWLDEAGLSFDHIDAASGGVFNLAMLCQGMSGREIADNWRTLDPVSGLDLNAEALTKLWTAPSMFTLDAYRARVFPKWGLDWAKIRASRLEATFNVYNFSEHLLDVLTPDRMTEDHLVACVSLPMWFPPVVIGGDTYIDSVFVTDANIEEAIRRGADEIWVIWTVSDKDEWRGGFVANYFQIIETSANGHYRRILRRIEENNAALERGERGEFNRPIGLKILKAEVGLHYLINLTTDRIAEAVNAGVLAARSWCAEQGIPLHAGPIEQAKAEETTLKFTEEMKGYVSFGGAADFDRGYREGQKSGNYLMFRLTITVPSVDRFMADPSHEARAEGVVRCDALGGELAVESGIWSCFVDHGDPARKHMLYRLYFQDGEGRPRTLSGFKDIKDDPGRDLFSDTTTLYVTLLEGHVGASEEAGAVIVGAGIIRIHLIDFMKQLTTFEATGPSIAARASAIPRFGRFFFGKLWDVYARNILKGSAF